MQIFLIHVRDARDKNNFSPFTVFIFFVLAAFLSCVLADAGELQGGETASR